MRWWRSHSVRVRLTLWYVATLVIVVGVYAAGVLSFVTRNASEALDQQLRRDFAWAAATIYQTPEGTFTWNEPEQLGDIQGLRPEEDLPWVQVWSRDGRLLFRNSEAQRVDVPESRSLVAGADGTIMAVDTDTVPMRILSRRDSIVDETSTREVDVVIQVARSEAEMRQGISQLLFILAVSLPLAVLVAGLGGYSLARRALLPVERMTDRARHISAERLNERLPVDNPDDEMGRLATVFNETLGRLEASFEQMRRFTSDVSHELRTPLTAIRSVGEVGLQERRDDASYRSIIGSMLEEVDRLASLVDRLLTLSRAETGDAKLKMEEVNLRELGESVAADLSVLAEEKRQSIGVEGLGAPYALADRLVLRQALINLVDNAIKFSPSGGRIRIRLSESGSHAIVDVIDTGPGIDAVSRERIFDRFYRSENHRGDTRGVGLGLSIAKGAVEANGGRLTLEATGNGGSTFRIALPTLARPRRRAAG